MLRDALDKKNEKYMVGFDLGRKRSQVSYCSLQNPQPESLAVVPGTQQFDIPTLLYKKNDFNRWSFGAEAMKASAEEGTHVPELIRLAERGEKVSIEGRDYEGSALLTLFMKRVLGLLARHIPLEKVDVLVITMEQLSAELLEVLQVVAEGLALAGTTICFQSYQESFYQYVIHQPQELWTGESASFSIDRDGITADMLQMNPRTTPVVSFCEHFEEETARVPYWSAHEDELALQKRGLDVQFRDTAMRLLQGRMTTAIYLLGDGFEGDWASDSLRFLCRGRRVFKGNNLYSKGAAYGALEKCCPSEIGKSHVFLGREKLQANVGLQVVDRGIEGYMPLLDAGVTWYEAKASYQLYLETSPQFFVAITPLTHAAMEGGPAGKYPVHYEAVALENFPSRPARASLVEIRVSMEDVEHLVLEIEDLGFGKIFQGTHQKWVKTLHLGRVE